MTTTSVETVLWFALGGERDDHQCPDAHDHQFTPRHWLEARLYAAVRLQEEGITRDDLTP